MRETHDGKIRIPQDRRRFETGIETLRDLADWLAVHPRVGHPELQTVTVPPAVALDVIDETWTIEPVSVSTGYCVFVREFGPYRLQLFTEASYFGQVLTIDGTDTFIPTPVRTLLRDRVTLMSKLELEGLL